MESQNKNQDTVTVVCGKCGKRVGNANPRIMTAQIFNCRHCWKENIYHPSTGEVVVKEIPPRTTSSGMTFV